MAKRSLACATWMQAAIMDGKDGQNCLMLAELTGFRWVCSRVTGDDGVRATEYVVQRGPGESAGNAAIDILNDAYYEGQPVFKMRGADAYTMSIGKEALLGTEAKSNICSTEVRAAIDRVVEVVEASELMARASVSSALMLKNIG